MSERNKEEVVSSEKKWPNWHEKIYETDHTLTPRIKKFIYLYVSTFEKLTLEQFAEKFKVNVSTIINWLAWPETKEEIKRLLMDTESRVLSLLETKEEGIIRGLLEMFNDKKTPAEVRRKLGYNLLSFGKLRDVNTGKTIVSQQQAIVSPYEKMSDEELREALAEIEELENG